MSFHVRKVLHVHVNCLNITFSETNCTSRTAIDDAKFRPVRPTEITITLLLLLLRLIFRKWYVET